MTLVVHPRGSLMCERLTSRRMSERRAGPSPLWGAARQEMLELSEADTMVNTPDPPTGGPMPDLKVPTASPTKAPFVPLGIARTEALRITLPSRPLLTIG